MYWTGTSVKAKKPVVWKAHTFLCMLYHCRGDDQLWPLSAEEKKRQVNWHLAFCDKDYEPVTQCWKTGGEDLTGKNNCCFVWHARIRGLAIRGREVLMSELGKLNREDNCGFDECSRVKFINAVNDGCSYTTARSHLNCTPRRNHNSTVSSGSESCGHSEL